MVTNAANSFNATIPAASAARVGQRIRVEKVDTGAGITTVARTGADTLGSTGATAFPLRVQGDFIELECVQAGAGYNWRCIDSLATLDGAAFGAAQHQTLAHGCGVKPRFLETVPKCGTAELGCAIGDEATLTPNWYDGGSDRRWGTLMDATNIHTGTGSLITIIRKDTGALAEITMANWYPRCRYEL
jgi:hypothetical protein